MKKTFLFLVLVIFTVSSVVAGPLVWANESEEAWESANGGRYFSNSVTTMTNLVENGGVYFLKSKAYFDLALAEMEAKKDYSEYLSNSKAYLKMTIDTYSALYDKAKSTPYNWNTTCKLWFFDYNSLGKNKIPSIWASVREKLQNGNTLEIYHYLLENCQELYRKMENRSTIESMWRRAELFSTLHMFGQYTAEVFLKI